MRSKYVWGFLAGSSLLATSALLLGIGLAIVDMISPVANGKPFEESANPQSEVPATTLAEARQIDIVALGDSLTKGTGDASGQGYVQHVVKGLKTRYNDKPIQLLNNLAVNGMQASQLADRLEHDAGYHYAIEKANLILISIGGNDLFRAARERLGVREMNDVALEELTEDMDEALSSFRRVAELLHKLNPSATIVYLGLYNPFYDISELRDASLNIQQWNMEAYESLHSYPNMRIIPIFDLFESPTGDHLSSDHFHPGSTGYERIAARVLDSL